MIGKRSDGDRVGLAAAGFDTAKHYPVLYILDGNSAFDACAAFHHEELRADETLTELIGAGKIPALIAVGVDNASYVLGNLVLEKDLMPHAGGGEVSSGGRIGQYDIVGRVIRGLP